MININGIDYAEMADRLMCDDETCLMIMKAFERDMTKKLSALCAEKDNDNFITLAHGIKGSCANISAVQCYRLAEKLEQKARIYGMKECDDELTALSVQLKALLKSIADYYC